MNNHQSRWQSLWHSQEFTLLLLLLGLFFSLYPLFTAAETMLAALQEVFLPWAAVILLLFLGRERRLSSRTDNGTERRKGNHA